MSRGDHGGCSITGRPLQHASGKANRVHFNIVELEQDGDHIWGHVTCSCVLEDDTDSLLTHTAQLVRDAYGESELRKQFELVALPEPDPLVSSRFDLSDVIAGFRQGLPDPEEEKKTDKPEHLRNYRSEAAEILTRAALGEVHAVQFPVHPQQGKVNANQPQLGFDGWGILGTAETGYSLVLIQVKATDANRCPPPDAKKLAEECKAVPRDKSKLCRALSVLALELKQTDMFVPLAAMLAQVQRDEPIDIVVAPVIVRGHAPACLDDLQPVIEAKQEYAPAVALGLVVKVGVNLTTFGERLMSLARAA